MYAQLIEHLSAGDPWQLVSRLVQEELLPSMRAEPGFVGAVDLYDRASGKSITIVFWETAAAAFRPPSEYNERFRHALAAIGEISGHKLAPLSVWEVSADVQSDPLSRLQALQAA